MQRKIFIPVLAGCLVLSAAMAGAAEDGKLINYVGVSGAVTVQSLDEEQTIDKFTIPPTPAVEFDDSWGIQIRAGHKYSDKLTAEAVFEYTAPFEALSGADSDELDVLALTVNAKMTAANYEKFTPYLVGGLGVMNAHEDIKYQGASSETTDWGLCVRIGAGIDYPLKDGLSVNFEAAYNSGLGDVDHVRYTSIGLGLVKSF